MFSQLTLAWPQFPVALILLLFPLPLFFGKGVEFRELSRAWGRVWTKTFSLPWHWIDLVRVAAGVWLLRTAIGLSHRTGGAAGHAELAIAAGVLILGMIVQSVACRAEGGFSMPFVYVLAATAMWFPPLLACLALVASLAGALACQSLGSFLWWLPVSLGAIGFWLYPDWLMLASGIGLSLGAALLPLLFQREFVLAHRALPVDPELLRPLR
jgi:hypothetical protein